MTAGEKNRKELCAVMEDKDVQSVGIAWDCALRERIRSSEYKTRKGNWRQGKEIVL